MYSTNGNNGGITPQPTPVVVPKLQTKETAYLRNDYPTLELLEGADVASWLMERQDQLLERAKDERGHSDAAKVLTGTVAAASALFYAASPLVPIGGAIAAIGYAVNLFQDTKLTHKFAPLPFIRGNIIEFFQAMGDAEERDHYFESRNETAEIVQYLEPAERSETSMLLNHLHGLTDYLSQVEPGKRFYAYRWLLRWYENLRGHLPSGEELFSHLEQVQPDTRINYDQVDAIATLQQETVKRIPPIGGVSLPKVQTASLPRANYETTTQSALPYQDEISTHNTQAKVPQAMDAAYLQRLPLAQRADAVIDLLEQSGFNLAKCCENQITAICGNQRGGKGTLMAILAILAQASDPNAKLYYYTAGVDLYPVRATKVVSALSFPNSKNPDSKVARATFDFFKQLSTATPGSLKDVIVVVDEAAGLLKDEELSDSERMWLIEFWFRALAKLGATVFIVLHAPNLTSLVGQGKTGGYATTFKSGAGWIGCKAESIKVSKLKSILRATGEYFVADPDDFGQAVEEIGTMPDWLKVETNPYTGQPDPVRSLLRIFPELYQDHTQNQVNLPIGINWTSSDPKEYLTKIQSSSEMVEENATEVAVSNIVEYCEESYADGFTKDESFPHQRLYDIAYNILEKSKTSCIKVDSIRTSRQYQKEPGLERVLKIGEVNELLKYMQDIERIQVVDGKVYKTEHFDL
jgi:hypothetical protein